MAESNKVSSLEAMCPMPSACCQRCFPRGQACRVQGRSARTSPLICAGRLQPNVVVASAMAKCRANAGDMSGPDCFTPGLVMWVIQAVASPRVFVAVSAHFLVPANGTKAMLALDSLGFVPCWGIAVCTSKRFTIAEKPPGATEELRSFLSARLAPSQRSFGPVLAACARRSGSM